MGEPRQLNRAEIKKRAHQVAAELLYSACRSSDMLETSDLLESDRNLVLDEIKHLADILLSRS